MSAFGGIIFTDRGRNLQAKAQSGITLNFTSIAVGNGELGTSAIKDLTALKNQVLTLSITKLKTLSGGKAVVGTVMSNQGLVTGFYWREVGVFAQDPDLGEILYCYGNSGAAAEYIPAGGGPDIVEKSIDVVTIVDNVTTVTATIEQSLVYETPAGAQEKIDTSISPLQKVLYLSNTIFPTTNVGNAYSITFDEGMVTALPDLLGIPLKVQFNADSTGVSTLNPGGLGAKGLKKAAGTDVTNFKSGGIYTLVWSGVNFTLQGEGGEYGTAGPAQVLATHTVGLESGVAQGIIPSKPTATYTPSQVTQTIAANQYLTAIQTISAVSFDATAVKNTTTIAGKTGTMAVNGSQTATLSIVGSGKPTKVIPAGYTPGGTVTAEVAAALASSILNTATIGGTTGTAVKLNAASGTIAAQTYSFGNPAKVEVVHTVSLGFTPSAVVISYTDQNAAKPNKCGAFYYDGISYPVAFSATTAALTPPPWAPNYTYVDSYSSSIYAQVRIIPGGFQIVSYIDVGITTIFYNPLTVWHAWGQ